MAVLFNNETKSVQPTKFWFFWTDGKIELPIKDKDLDYIFTPDEDNIINGQYTLVDNVVTDHQLNISRSHMLFKKGEEIPMGSDTHQFNTVCVVEVKGFKTRNYKVVSNGTVTKV